jgi:hypothetical protein
MRAPFVRAASAQSAGEELVVYPARLRLLLALAGLLVADVVAFLGAFGFPPSFQLSLTHVMGLCILLTLTAVVVVCLLGLFSPLPLFSISHEGVRTYSLFGLFGTDLIPWPHVRRFVTYQSRGQQYLNIYTDNQVPADRWRLTHRLLRRETEFMRVYVSSGVMSGSMDVLLEQIDRRFGREIDENGVALIDCGEH